MCKAENRFCCICGCSILVVAFWLKTLFSAKELYEIFTISFLKRMAEKAVKQEIQKLIDKFERVRVEGRYKKYNEEQTKKNFFTFIYFHHIKILF